MRVTAGKRAIRVAGLAAGLVLVLAVGSGCADTGTVDPGSDPSASARAPDAKPDMAEPNMAESDPLLQARIDEATMLAADQGITVGIAVLDRETGEEIANGEAAMTPVLGASIVKVFLAENLLFRQRAGEFALPPADRVLLEAMLVDSDDAATDSLYDRYGGDAMVVDVATRYELDGVAPTTQAGEWELTSMAALDVVRFYAGFLDTAPATDRDYLLDLLRRTAMIAADEFDQFFGIPAALPDEEWAVKQGWMCCPRETSHLHTTGILGTDSRYTVAILSRIAGDEATATEFAIGPLNEITAAVFPEDFLDDGP